MPNISAGARKTVGEEQEQERTGLLSLEPPRCAANSLSVSFRGDTGAARRAPPKVWGEKKETRRASRKYSPSLRQSRGRFVFKKQRRLKRDKYKESSRRVQVVPALRSKAALMASVLGNSSRASGAQSGQVKCKLKRRRRRRSKRKGKTLQDFSRVPFLCCCEQRSSAPWRSGGAHGEPAAPPPLRRRTRAGCSLRAVRAARRLQVVRGETVVRRNAEKGWCAVKLSVGSLPRVVLSLERRSCRCVNCVQHPGAQRPLEKEAKKVVL